jgi:hypothetical protein
MHPEDQDRLEREIHDALRRLPAPRAPRTLAPRVMQAVAAAARAQTGWRRWPQHWQLLGVVVACSTIVAVALGTSLATAWIGSLESTRAAIVLWQTFVAPAAIPLTILTAVMCAACALLAAALKHVAWEGRETSLS